MATSEQPKANHSPPLVLRDIKNIDSSKINIISPRQPRSSARSPNKDQIQIARVNEVKFSSMGALDRAVIQFRKCKASLLAELPPVVEISVLDDPHEEKTNTEGKSCS